MSGIDIGDYSEEEMDAILESGDPDLIEAFLSGNGKVEPADDDQVLDDDSDKKPEQEVQESDVDTPEKKEDVTSESSSAEGEERYVETKTGGHKIPYAVLEAERKRAADAIEELGKMQTQLTELQNRNQKVTAYLDQNGIDLDSLESGEVLSEQQLQELADLDPAVAKLAKITMALYERQSQGVEQVPQAPGVSPVDLAIRSNADLTAWRKEDPDRWSMAVHYDDLLKHDPAFQNASLDDRFAEAVKRTKAVFGDSLEQQQPKQRETPEQIAAKKLAAASQAQVPGSLTSLGKTPAAERTLTEIVADLDGDALVDQMANMTPEQIDKILGGVEL